MHYNSRKFIPMSEPTVIDVLYWITFYIECTIQYFQEIFSYIFFFEKKNFSAFKSNDFSITSVISTRISIIFFYLYTTGQCKTRPLIKLSTTVNNASCQENENFFSIAFFYLWWNCLHKRHIQKIFIFTDTVDVLIAV